MAKPFYIGRKDVGMCLTPGIKIWTNGMPLKADTYKSCSNTCNYCFARNLSASVVERNGVKYDPHIARTMDMKLMARYFDRAARGEDGWVFWALRERKYLELGTMCEVFQWEEETMAVTWDFLQLCRAYKIPLLINTKANLLTTSEKYRRLIFEYPAPIIMSVTITNVDDKVTRGYEPNAPPPSARLKLIRDLRAVGIPSIVYCGPFLKGVTDVDLEHYVATCIESGAVGIHLRNLYLTGKLMQQGRWKRFVAANKDSMVRNGAGYKMSGRVLEEVYLRMQAIADRIDPRFRVVGMKTHWYRLNPYHGKLAMDWLPPAFHEGMVDFTAIPIMRKVRERIDTPQLMEWDRLGYSPRKIGHPRAVPIVGGPTQSEGDYLREGCYKTRGGQLSWIGQKWMHGWDWVKGALWNGLDGTPSGFVGHVQRCYPVSSNNSNGGWARSTSGDFKYAYVPPELRDELVVSGAVREEDADGFFKPKRPKGTQDKFYADARADAFDLGDRWTS